MMGAPRRTEGAGYRTQNERFVKSSRPTQNRIDPPTGGRVRFGLGMRRRLLVVLAVFYAALVGLLIVAPQVLAKRDTTQTCTGALSHATTGEITVPVGAVCRVSGSTGNGSVTVLRDAYFEAWGTKISGSVNASGALTVFLHD